MLRYFVIICFDTFFFATVYKNQLTQVIIYLFEFRGMNEFISPHQNININISYNLGSEDKMPKVVFGKKIAKIVKSTVKEQPKSFFKTFKKNEEQFVNVNNDQAKKGKSSKKMKPKKKSNTLFTLPDQQQPVPIPRRLKTQGNTKGEIVNSLIKKQHKSNSKAFSKTTTHHFKSLHNPPTPLHGHKTFPKKPPTLSTTYKPKKEQRRNSHSNKSCILYPKKHILLSDVEHIVSTTTSGPTPVSRQAPAKKRANSASVIRSDKFINKLLDMSVLTSQLGGSIPMNTNTNINANANGNQNKGRANQNNSNRIKTALQGFMSSIDMRIIKNMEQDNRHNNINNKKSIFVDFNIGDGLQLITFLNKIRRIPMDKLNQKAAKIQKFWRKKQGQSIIPYYSNMFFRNPAINSKAAIEQHLQDISDIDINENIQSEIGLQNTMLNPLGKKQEKACFLELISAAKVSDTSQSQFFDESSISAAKINKILENKTIEPKQEIISQKRQQQVEEFGLEESLKDQQKQFQAGQKTSLNIEKYKQLVRQSIQQQKKPFSKNKLSKPQQGQSSSQGGRENKEQISTQAHWNHVHNILSTNMNKKVPLMSKTVLQELMKQSAYNKQWVEGQFSNSQSRKISPKSSPRVPCHEDTIEQLPKSHQDREYYFEEKEEDEGLQRQEYNWNKYSDIGKLKNPQQVTIPRLKDKQKSNQPYKITSQNLQSIPGLLPPGIKNNNFFGDEPQQKYKQQNRRTIQKSQSMEQLEKDQKWIREQMIMEDGIVEKYLDCGLDYFGLNLDKNNKKISPQIEEDITIEQLQEREVQEKEEHRATLQKQHHTSHVQHETKEKHNVQEHPQKDDDIFSNQAVGPNPDDDMELVYVFQNIDGKKSKPTHQIDLEHAAKNSKRNDNVDHLGIRQQNKQENEEIKNVPLPLFEPTFSRPPQNETYTSQQISIQQQLNTKRKQKITQQIITKLIEEFARDVSTILKKSHQQQTKQSTKLYQISHSGTQARSHANEANQNLMTGLGIKTSFQSIQLFITKLKNFVLGDQECCRKIIENLKNNIGPSSMEILSYLRIEDQNQITNDSVNLPSEEQDNEEWLFVIPNQLFEVFNKKLLDEEQMVRGKKLSNKFKLYTEFWHRSIFQCYNECLDYERPYGITGAPYTWICEPKLPRQITYSQFKVIDILQSAQNRLLELSCSSSGIIFDKPESPYRQFEITEQNRVQMNQEKISRMLANEILDDEYNWITYNDEITELLVDISRKVEELLVFQVGTDLKKLMRKRKMMVHAGGSNRHRERDREKGRGEQSSSEDDQHVVFMVEDLV